MAEALLGLQGLGEAGRGRRWQPGLRGAPGFPGGAEKLGCPAPGSPGRRCPFGRELCCPATLAPRPALPQGSAPSCRGVCIRAVSLSRTGFGLRRTHFPNTGARTPWRPRRRRRGIWRAGRSEAESPRSGPLRSPHPRCPPGGMTGPQEAETRGPGAPLAGRWEPARLLRSEHGGWPAGGGLVPSLGAKSTLLRVGVAGSSTSCPPVLHPPPLPIHLSGGGSQSLSPS